jgi:predicted Zn-dependent protease
MIGRAVGQRLVPILKKDCARALTMKMRGFPRPYYCSFLLRDIEWFNTWASSGSIYRLSEDRTRNLFCDIRVGSYRYDQVSDGGLLDNDDELDSYNYIKMPIDDSCYDGLRLGLWRLCEAKFREALADYSDRRASGVSSIDRNRNLRSFSKFPRTQHLAFGRRVSISEDGWKKYCKNGSAWLSKLKNLTANWIEFDVTQETRIFVNTEGSVIVQPQQIFSIVAGMRRLTRDGLQIEQEYVKHAPNIEELPSLSQLKVILEESYERLGVLERARTIHSFSGPVLLYPKSAGLLFHEAIGHRLEGSRLLSSGEGQTFKGQIGKRCLNIPLTIRDNPNRKMFGLAGCIGSYSFDDEGVAAQNALLVENGVLQSFLTTRAECKYRGFSPNGHARSKRHQRPISRMAVTEVEAPEGKSIEELRALLLELVRSQRKPFGLIVYETTGGETDTTSFDFQAFSGQIAFATLLYPDGTEAPVRGIDFVGTPLQALGNIVAAGAEQEMENHYCGAESGFLPVTTISPAVLLSTLELQLKDEELLTQFVLPKPKPQKR